MQKLYDKHLLNKICHFKLKIVAVEKIIFRKESVDIYLFLTIITASYNLIVIII